MLGVLGAVVAGPAASRAEAPLRRGYVRGAQQPGKTAHLVNSMCADERKLWLGMQKVIAELEQL